MLVIVMVMRRLLARCDIESGTGRKGQKDKRELHRGAVYPFIHLSTYPISPCIHSHSVTGIPKLHWLFCWGDQGKP